MHDDVIADVDLLPDLLGVHAEIDEELGDLGDLLAILRRRDVDGLAAGIHDPEIVAAVAAHQHPPGKEISHVKSARGVQPEGTLLVDVADVEPDLIHVRRDHDARRPLHLRRAFGFARTDERPHRVGPHLVKEAIDAVTDQSPHPLLATGHAGCLAQLAK